MVFLVGDVAAEVANMARADGERAVAVLPMEVSQGGALGLQPLGRIALQFAHEVGDGEFAPEAAEDVNVVRDAADDERGRVEVAANPSEIGVRLGENGCGLEERLAVLGGEDEVEVDLSERLRHGAGPRARTGERVCWRIAVFRLCKIGNGESAAWLVFTPKG